jgi:DNA helicase IV
VPFGDAGANAAAIRQELAGSADDSALVQDQLSYRLSSLEDDTKPLCFGRIDGDGETHYIGRRHVKDERDEPMVIDWRAPAATPFYRATVSDAMDLTRRRHFSVKGRQLIDIFDELFDDPDSLLAGAHTVPDPLLAELSRARTGEMRDIVATIQAEQDVIIRTPLNRLVVVQGGPGTGKTAVGLHRAAFLLYEHRRKLERDTVLVVGPNDLFLRYVSQVLPSLGETAVLQTTIEGLFSTQYPVKAEEGDDVARLKGDIRMASVLRKLCNDMIGRAADDMELLLGRISVTLPASLINGLLRSATRDATTLEMGRKVFRQRLADAVYRRYTYAAHGVAVDQEDFLRSLSEDSTFRRTVDRLFPSFRPPAVVREMLTNARVLGQSSDGILTPSEQELLLRSRPRRTSDWRWSRADLALLDEVEVVSRGTPRLYGHVIVDEAQDLSPMELRMLARRSRNFSMTVLGDLAQATGLWLHRTWDDVLEYMGRPSVAEFRELDIGYRVPAPILELANRLLSVAAPDVRPARSARVDGMTPAIVGAQSGGLADAVREQLGTQTWQTIAVITPDALASHLGQQLEAAGVEFSDWTTESLDKGITLLKASVAKGLEFDAVIVVEPSAIFEQGRSGPVCCTWR